MGGQLVERAHELLGDGEWHSYEQVARELCRLVPPGKAIRRSENERFHSTGKRYAKGEYPQERVRYRDTSELIRTGARSYVRDFLHHRNFEVRGAPRDPDRQIRLIRPPSAAEPDQRRMGESRRRTGQRRDEDAGGDRGEAGDAGRADGEA